MTKYYIDGDITYAASWEIEVPEGENPIAYAQEHTPQSVDRMEIVDWYAANVGKDEGDED